MTVVDLPRPTTVAPAATPVAARLLETASALFYEHGIRAVGVELIAAEAFTTKKSLYDRFGSKDALVAAYLGHRAAAWQESLLARLADVTPGRDRVLAVLDELEAWSARRTRGCAFVNAHAELGGTDHPGLAVVRAEKAWMRRLLTALVAEADLAADPAELGAQLHVVYEGVLVVLTAGEDPDAVAHGRRALHALLDAAPRG